MKVPSATLDSKNKAIQKTLRGSRSRDDNLLRDIISLYLQQHPEKTQADIAEYLHATPNALSRFIRINTVKSKPEWIEPIFHLGLEINYEQFALRAAKVVDVLEDIQSDYLWNCFIDAFSREYCMDTLRPSELSVRRIDADKLPVKYVGAGLFFYEKDCFSGIERWCFAVFGGKEVRGTDVMGILSKLHQPVERFHVVLIVEDKKAYQDVEATLSRAKLTDDHRTSITIMLMDKMCGSIVDSFTDGDLGIKRRSEQEDETPAAPL